MRVTPRTIEMKAQEYTDYLKEEGLDAVIAARQAAGEADKPAKELYARYAKIAIRTGGGGGTHLTQPAGLKAEFVPTSDPTAVRAGGMLTVRFLADGKPVSGAPITALSDGVSVKGQTDANGHVTLKIDREGHGCSRRFIWCACPGPHQHRRTGRAIGSLSRSIPLSSRG